MSDLKPCPFCGKEQNKRTAELDDSPCFYYECENPKCGASEMGWHDTEQEARDAWNTLSEEIHYLLSAGWIIDSDYSRIKEVIRYMRNQD